MPSWLLKEYADFLAGPISDLLCCFFDVQNLPSSWNYADVMPLPKKKHVTIITKHIRPISLTPVISEVAEEFIVRNHVGPAVLDIINSNQFGAIPKSSTIRQALISMVHDWAKATDRNGSAVRIIVLD